MGLKIVGNIDLSQFDKKPSKLELRADLEAKEGYNDMLDSGLKNMAAATNNRFGHFLKSDVSIDTAEYKFPNKETDQKFVEEKERVFAAERNMTREEWLIDREKARGIITEKVLTLLFYKFFGEDFIIARTAAYDDYCHGVDMMIINLETGAPICGVDEMGADDAYSYYRKGQKIYDIIGHNGAYVKYGATFRNGELQKKAIKNVPAFFMSLDEADLKKLLPALATTEVSEVESSIIQRILSSFDGQMATLYKGHVNVKENLFASRNSLLSEQEELKETLGEEVWSQTEEGLNWKARMGQNNMRLNLLNFKKSLQKMKETHQKLKP